ncbi:MAG: hypothetical protein WC977_06745 [Anaerovoracaceae bacterium]
MSHRSTSYRDLPSLPDPETRDGCECMGFGFNHEWWFRFRVRSTTGGEANDRDWTATERILPREVHAKTVRVDPRRDEGVRVVFGMNWRRDCTHVGSDLLRHVGFMIRENQVCELTVEESMHRALVEH